METTFHNVTITVEAENPKDAYNLLCVLLGSRTDIEYTTDTFSTRKGPMPKPTTKLFPR